ncbi:5,10-methylene tetrahydromethanopterin reductase [Pararhizobium polonicum]|uniref:5,10-methylene tetrahydromethanopterin reductase n=1 Tax=Pararhizobium polonicum TaxID=1612624 RepID=A0A1C7P162_9HYPH|nr:LLM class flavin-dependent oxidoreductase [Pararhizobium polonicum]OBZ93414.1 5,10-methylene tetrahydromethanopterin reductase [Pararhizobium polonicum]
MSQSQQKKPIVLNGFAMTVPAHVSAGVWRHPSDRSHDYTKLSYWTGLARLLDEGGFDNLFIADALGPLDVFGGTPDAALRTAAQQPLNDPLVLVAAMAGATRRLGFGITVSTTYEQPYLLARKFSTLDHLTKGRIAWNVVTSILESAARNLGHDQQMEHNTRYDYAQEFLEVAYKLWEGSWEDDALVRDRKAGLYTDPSKVHPILHEGRFFKVPDAHVTAPSPQRTPLIFQAGTSPRGREFAARNAEVVFLGGTNPAQIRASVDAIRARAVELGRRADSLRFITAIAAIPGETEAEAQAKYQDYLKYTSIEAALALFSAWTGVDWAQYDLDQPLEYIETNAGRSALRGLTAKDSERRWTVRDIAEYIGVGGIHPKLIGTGAQIADQMEELAEAAGVDGFNIAYAVSPGSFEDFIRHVIPELRARGRLTAEGSGRTLRGRLIGTDRLGEDHPGAAFRSIRNGPSVLDQDYRAATAKERQPA